MKVFLSWSGARSKQVAQAMRDWLPNIFNDIELFMSSEIEAGLRWQSEIADQLANTHFGIIFVTSENQGKPWINFEAGALAKSITNTSHVVPLAIDLDVASIELPLGQFQADRLDADGISHLMVAMNSAAGRPLPDERVTKIVAKWWPDLEEAIQKSRSVDLVRPRRSEREMLEEIVSTLRGIARDETSIRRLAARQFRPSTPESDDIVSIIEDFYRIAKERRGVTDVSYSPVTRLVTVHMSVTGNVRRSYSASLRSRLRALAAQHGVDVRFIGPIGQVDGNNDT